MEHENNYASRGAANTGLGLGIAGTALGLMAGGLNGTGLFGGNARMYATKTITSIAMSNLFRMRLRLKIVASHSWNRTFMWILKSQTYTKDSTPR